ncbi:hypothetical protein NEUTE1DRAFT_118235 [Neurospora tetrasperma FGSC 2508]|uniref:Uncharacterized protein n=1 Tax=Neurospora tetrasperma (strain FGSC 2508 / ATCC MYA-4615 / P0657) TaxID=510951 RepID=F8MUT2_NEUT8|nr:uncharacterized protein NEUTE1DRAFT_118235 [Neurospora tetrasperma FGSC 2508]EGO54557.1 hypothetical protein NEUTE1DRAFT_118235 [Neurospora tetrasperma FGSC 2508]EGZ67990.1 hypothetical protein NEUTE2DRAFT_145798 [Neurospora tetrasperma FGSC 2509]
MVEVFRLFYFQVCPESADPNRPTLVEQVGGETKVNQQSAAVQMDVEEGDVPL